ncbi:50S ribosomal protein L13 [Candidatus Amesbacteria bacterium RIFCSPHIGHO2_01_FULL_48_32]|uniref:Large ribosomal subunit protein uL13 n=1 Tax=Candidatus Amesbacteria bacterium RIFCSPLOWO2_01_FULL_48_25 TaxID=1797259 RepID=A0A1F4ZBG1_9BACT|nr:MAG: 50S ribosomal protein L13 [Candidatus Amesbacteria bacterium RIFCSPHIGHO2_01_FULL_48_32]OGD03266.1 MAG: 50S ribosomal protein L13 [Candidatus Amesbacteria bacterium RIFCSPLOWO2_01_FULL_48_25]HJZ05214.1 50S ribosomal protein L13 [Patescibacteria group bacterium]
MPTLSPKLSQINRDWHLVDANGQVLGRMATRIARLLMGKNRVDFSRHLDMGDHVVIINAAKVKVTGRKSAQKLYHRHSGYPGGMVVLTYAQVQASHPDRIITHAISGMLPKNKLHDRMLKHLHVYPGPDHPYAKQFKK